MILDSEPIETRDVVVCPLHWYFDRDHLAHVIEQMRELGPPEIRGAYDTESGCFLLREGTHRIRAAEQLGLVPSIRVVRWWRNRAALLRARFAAARYGLLFAQVRCV